MKIDTLTVTRTIQITQYEPLVLSATATLDQGDDPIACSQRLLAVVKRVLWDAAGGMRRDLQPTLMDGSEDMFDPRD